jgi:DnaJ-domain-containing protein 1
MGALRLFALSLALSLAAAAASARADELIMPFACEMDHGAPRLYPANANVYNIIGPREDLPFSSCAPSPSGTCEMMMVHKFTIECAGQRVAWSKVAASARAVGIELPGHLPAGYAPISRLAGRFVLPGFGHKTQLMTRVATQDLSPDSVTETASPPSQPRPELAQWVTVVDSEARVASSSGEAFKVAGVVSTLLASLMAGCLLVARRRPLLSFEPSGLPSAAGALANRAAGFVASAFARVSGAFRHSYQSWQAASGEDGSDAGLNHALDLVHARLGETELLVATLPGDLLLRDVLQSELDGLRQRAADVARRARRLGADRAKSAIHALMRDLDRITRIVHGAGQRADTDVPAEPDPPASVFEAYRVLGLNPEAPQSAVKKVVDALRVSWHPDHARDEADRLYREQRLKQINAAWDLLKVARAQAA